MNSPAGIVLASASPRRIDLLRSMGFDFEIVPAQGAEPEISGQGAEEYVRLAAMAKAVEVADRFPDHLIIGADTVVELEERIIGKPAHAAQAREFLADLSGQWHSVWTGMALLFPAASFEMVEVVRSGVRFRALDTKEIDDYMARGESLDKAGAYAFQGGAAGFVAEVVGSENNVIGLPTERLGELLKEHFPSLPC